MAGIGTAAAGLTVPNWYAVAAMGQSAQRYFPLSEAQGGWRAGDPRTLGVNPDRLRHAVQYHDDSSVTRSHGGALIIIHQGYVVSETYITGADGGPQPWTARTCNDMKSSTKSVFGTAVGVFLDEAERRPLVVDRDGHVLLRQLRA